MHSPCTCRAGGEEGDVALQRPEQARGVPEGADSVGTVCTSSSLLSQGTCLASCLHSTGPMAGLGGCCLSMRRSSSNGLHWYLPSRWQRGLFLSF